jgi:hypothetical protein
MLLIKTINLKTVYILISSQNFGPVTNFLLAQNKNSGAASLVYFRVKTLHLFAETVADSSHLYPLDNYFIIDMVSGTK